jgi:hypothetical protein
MVILKEQEVKDFKGRVIGIQRIEIDSKGIETALGKDTQDDKTAATQADKEKKLKEGGYTTEDINKIKAAKLI